MAKRQSKKDKSDELIAEALNRWSKADRAEYDERENARDDRIFATVIGEQWDKKWNNNDISSPKFEINRIQHSINQVIGEFSKNTIGIKVRPDNGEANTEIAETYDGLIRNISAESHFNHVQLEAFKEMALSGFGAWRVKTDFLNEQSFEQGVTLEWIADALTSVWFDPYDKDPLKRNAKYCFIVQDLDKDTYKELYPDSAMQSFDRMPYRDQLRQTGWINENGIRVAEYFRKVEKTKTILQMSSGDIYDLDDVKDVLDEIQAAGVEVVNRRKVKFYDIEWYKINGVEILEGPVVWPGKKYIPVVPVYGFHDWIDGRFMFRGMVRHAKDAQRVYNYITSAKIEAAANSPKDPIFISPKMVQGYEDQYSNFNVRNTPFLFLNPDEKMPQGPFRLGAPLVQQALIEQGAQAERDIQATLGRSEASLGQTNMAGIGGGVSGTALNAVQRQSNVGQEELFANTANAVEYTAEILIDIIPNVYTAEQQIRILQPDGQSEFVPINQQQQDVQTGETFIFNDLNQGKYDVEATLGPSFQSQREETIAMLQALSVENPAFMQVTADILAKSIDHPLSDEIAKRIRKQMVEQGLVDPNEEEAKAMQEAAANKQPDPVEELNFKTMQLNAELLAGQVDLMEANIIKMQADTTKSLADAEKSSATSAKSLSDMVIEQMEAGLRENQATMAAIAEQTKQAMSLLDEQISTQIDESFNRVAPQIYNDPTPQAPPQPPMVPQQAPPLLPPEV